MTQAEHFEGSELLADGALVATVSGEAWIDPDSGLWGGTLHGIEVGRLVNLVGSEYALRLSNGHTGRILLDLGAVFGRTITFTGSGEPPF